MKKRIGILVMILVLCIGVLPMAASADDTFTYIALGDSITYGTGLTTPGTEGFVAKLASTIQTEEGITVNYSNNGVSGLTAATLATTLDASSLADAELITITIGGNDLMAVFYDTVAAMYNTEYSASITAETLQTWFTDTTEYATEVANVVNLLTDYLNLFSLISTMQTASATCVSNIATIISSIRAVNDTAIILLANQYNPYASFTGTYSDVSTLFNTVVLYFNSTLAANATIISGCTIVDVYTATVSTNATESPLYLDFHPDAIGHSTIAYEMYTAYRAGCIHNWDEGTVTTEATCTEDGVKTFKCTNSCGTTKTVTIAATGHSYDAGAVTTEATCTENGVMTYTCNTCGHTYTGEIPATGHDYDTNGFCTVCGKYEPAVLNGTTYEISNAGQLFWFAALVNGDTSQEGITAAVSNANAILTDDINLEDRPWTPIGSSASPYYGTFDGQGRTISGLIIDGSSDYQGLFGSLSGTVQKVTVSGGVSGSSYVGSIAGYNSGTISGSINYCTVSGTGSYTGGIAGYNTGTISGCTNFRAIQGVAYVGGIAGYSSGEIIGCTNGKEVTGTSANGHHVGGIVGDNSIGTITYCTNSGSISGSVSYVGGIAGQSYNGTVTYCSNSGSVSGTSRVGGIVGSGESDNVVKYCYNTASVSGTGNEVGGVAGYCYLASVTGCYSTGWVSGTESIGGIVGYNAYFSVVENCCTTYSSAVGEKDENIDVTNTVTLTTDQFASGAAAYILNGNSSTSPTWYQTIGTDAYPVWDNTHGTVYYGTDCAGTAIYSNENLTGVKVHVFEEDGFCTCGQYEPAVLNGTTYEISNAGQLFWFAALVNGDDTYADFDAQNESAKAILTDEIDLEDRPWTPIGNFIGTGNPAYSGTFNGGGYEISRLYISSITDECYQGLFGYVDSSGEVLNLTVSGYVSAAENVGGIAGYNAGTISASFSGTVIGKYNDNTPCANVGGIAGYNEGTISDSTSDATVTGGYYVGGIAGCNVGTIEECSNSGTISASAGSAGGIAGMSDGGTVTSCTNKGQVSSYGNAGGIVGYNYGEISDCSNSGAVTSVSNSTGGIAGTNTGGTITDCSNSGKVSGTYYVGGIAGYSTGTISGCTNSATITGTGDYVGGIAGYSTGTITSCTNSEAVSGTGDYVGGIAGYSTGTITSCTNTDDGTITGSGSSVGGIAGENEGKVTYCSNSGAITGMSDSTGGIVGHNRGTVEICCNTAAVSSGASYVGGVVGCAEDSTVTSCYSTGTINGGYATGGVVGWNYNSTVENCCTTYSITVGENDGTVTNTVTLTTEEFASGKAAYILNGNSSTSPIWYQTIGTDALPVWDNTHGTVYYGTDCAGTAIYSNTTVPPAEHSYVASVTDPTCTEKGYTTYECSICGNTYTGDEVEANGHTDAEAVIENQVAATCTEDGSYDSVVYCDVCGDEISRETITIDKTGHSYTTQVVDPTYTERGYTIYTCDTCGYSYVDDYTDILVLDGTDSSVTTQVTIGSLTDLPDGLKGIYSSVDALVADLISRVTVTTGYTEENAVVYDVYLQYSLDGSTWVTATVDNFPIGGITVTIPYPDGTDASYDFIMMHMFTETSTRLGITAGETETLAVTKTDDGLMVTLTGMSPVAISWKAPATTTTTTSAKTGDSSRIGIWAVLLLASAAGICTTVVYGKARRR